MSVVVETVAGDSGVSTPLLATKYCETVASVKFVTTANSAGDTMSVTALAVTPFNVAVITVVAPIAGVGVAKVARPVLAPMMAVVGVADVQVTAVVMFAVVLLP